MQHMTNVKKVDVKRLKILHVITTIDMGGAEKALLNLAQTQIEHNFEISVLPLKGQLELLPEFMKAKCKVLTDAVNKSVLIQMRVIRKYAKDFDVIHCHLPRAELISTLAVKNTPIVVTKHNSENMLPQKSGLISLLLSRYVYARSKFVICISNAVKVFLENESELPRGSDKVKVIYYGFCLPSKKTETFSAGRKSQNRIGTISRLELQKNLSFFIEVIKSISLEKDDISGYILGSGSLYDHLLKEISNSQLADKLVILPKTPKVFEFLNGLDVFLLTSSYEGFGLVLLESMACDIPIVAFNHSAIPEVLGTGHLGLVEPGDLEGFAQKVKLFLESDTIRNRVILYQQRRLLEFGNDIQLRSVSECYENAIKAK